MAPGHSVSVGAEVEVLTTALTGHGQRLTRTITWRCCYVVAGRWTRATDSMAQLTRSRRKVGFRARRSRA